MLPTLQFFLEYQIVHYSNRLKTEHRPEARKFLREQLHGIKQQLIIQTK